MKTIPTSEIIPLPGELMVLSMFILEFHRSIDINEDSPKTLRSGKDLARVDVD